VTAAVVVWHDLECGSYAADLPLWRRLAAEEAGPILDVGAGTGRVALDLAARGHAVTAVDRDPDLIAALRERAAAAGLAVDARVADAEALDLGDLRFGLVLIPMQTIQLLGDRPAFLAGVRRHLAPGGLFAAALADALEGWDSEGLMLPAADVVVRDGWRFASQPVAVRERSGHTTIERIRTTLAPDGTRSAEPDRIDLVHLGEATLHAEGAAAGLEPRPGIRIAETDEHVGSQVVLLRG
jgi:SAM-dependent methyltransferase